MKSARAGATAWCENGHSQRVTVLHATFKDGRLVGGYCGSAADFCDTCDGPVVEVWPDPPTPAMALASYVPSDNPGFIVPTVGQSDGTVRVVHPGR